jgi:hypothetical protein
MQVRDARVVAATVGEDQNSRSTSLRSHEGALEVLKFENGVVQKCRDGRVEKYNWADLYGPGSWEQNCLDEALKTIAADPLKRPWKQIDVIEEDSVFYRIWQKAEGFGDDRRSKNCHGLTRAIEISQVARVLDEQRPGPYEDVAYVKGVGLRVSWKKGTDELLAISPGLIDPFRFEGQFGMANPLWLASIMGESVISSGASFARELAFHGVFCDADALNEILDACLRQELRETAEEQVRNWK